VKQVLQSLKTGAIEVAEVPCPAVSPGKVLIRTRRSLISPGTERMLVEFGRAGWIEKIRQQPEKVRQVLDKIRTDGLLATIEAVQRKLDQPVALGYSNVGVVEAVGEGVTWLVPGDRVVSNGPHAELVCVPHTLCAKVPDTVSDEEAAFAVLGAIALESLRLAQPTLGEVVAVIGLGVIGLLAGQLLQAHGCRVLGLDLDPRKLDLARQFGFEPVDLAAGADPLLAAQRLSRGHGIDAAIVAAATRSSEPLHQAARLCRKRGRIVLVGVTGMQLSRTDFYDKELSFAVSCSYGPGRYDPQYEDRGQDYPVGFVRWTAQRNIEAVLDQLAARRLTVAPLISHRFAMHDAPAAYEQLTQAPAPLGILFTYPEDSSCGPECDRRTVYLQLSPSSVKTPTAGSSQSPTGDGRAVVLQEPVVGFIGAGTYGAGVLMPAFRAAGARVEVVASRTGLHAVHAGRRHQCRRATTDVEALINDPAINTVVIATRHDSHAALVCQALRAGKHVFVEKPLCVTREELQTIETVYASGRVSSTSSPLLMVGFNRRFAPHVRRMRALLAAVSAPKSVVITVNAGMVPATHWTLDPVLGGGRVVGEACHFVDLLRYVIGASIRTAQAAPLAGSAGPTDQDQATLTLSFADGSLGTIHYFTNGHRSFPKERLEVFCGGRVLVLDNFRRLRGYGWPNFRRFSTWRQDKGQAACVAAFLEAIRQGGPAPIPLDELLEVSRVTIDLAAHVAASVERR
jgi:predicted dehydrogenase